MDNQDPNLDPGTQDPIKPDEELDLDLEEGDQGAPPADDVESLKQRNADLEAKNKQLYARIKKQKPQPTLPTQKPKDDMGNVREAGTRLSALELAESKRQYAWENNLSPEETDAVFRLNSNPTKETLNDIFIKGGLEAFRAKKRVENAIPSPSSRSSAVDGKSFADMTPEEREKNFSKVAANFKKK